MREFRGLVPSCRTFVALETHVRCKFGEWLSPCHMKVVRKALLVFLAVNYDFGLHLSKLLSKALKSSKRRSFIGLSENLTNLKTLCGQILGAQESIFELLSHYYPSFSSNMKALNVENLKKLKRALQKKKINRIDSYRLQIGRCDYPQSRDNLTGLK